MKPHLRTAAAAVLVSLLVALAACGGSSGPPQVGINARDYELTPTKTTSVKAGAVTFIVKNIGNQVHELAVVRTDLDPTKVPVDDKTGALKEDGAGLTFLARTANIGAGASAKLTMTLPAGKYLLYCNLADHFKRHMYMLFTVT